MKDGSSSINYSVVQEHRHVVIRTTSEPHNYVGVYTLSRGLKEIVHVVVEWLRVSRGGAPELFYNFTDT